MPGTTLKITDLVQYRGERYRVAYYKKRVEDNFPNNQIDLMPHETYEMPEFMLKILQEEILEEKQERAEKGLPHTRRWRYQICTQDEATHVSLYGLTYPIAPIEDVIYEGPISWSPELIALTTEEAISEFRLKRFPFSDWNWE